MLWFGLGVLNLALAALIWRDSRVRVSARLVALWLVLNGVSGAVLQSGAFAPAPPYLEPAPVFHASLLLQAATAGIILLVPFILPRPLASRRAMRAVYLAAALHGAIRLWIEATDIAGARLPWSETYLAFDRLVVPFATLVALDRHLRASTDEERVTSRIVLSALALTTMAFTAYYARTYDDPVPETFYDGSTLLDVVAGAGAILAVALALLSRRLREPSSASGDGMVVGAVAVGALFFVPTLAVGLSYLLFRPLLFAYALLHGALASLDLRRHLGTLLVVVLSAGVPLFIATSQASSAAFADPLAGQVLAALAVLAMLFLVARALAPGLFSNRAAATSAREAYRAALTEALRHEQPHHIREPVLAALRRTLRISEREHAILEMSVRGALAQGDRALAPGHLVLGKYRVVAELGQGGAGQAWLARDERLGRDVALKVARHQGEREAQAALREATALARLSDPHVVALYDAELVGSDVILVMEHVAGGDLASRLAGPMRADEAIRIVDDVLQGLAAAHARGILHRDVKAENVLLASDGTAKLGDFGTAEQADPGATATSMTLQPARSGSLAGMAPEQVRGAALDARTDLYAVGALLYRCLAGRPYLDLRGRTLAEAQVAILDEEPLLPLPGLPDALNALLASALAKEPAARPSSAGEFREKLAAARHATPT